MGKRLEIGIGEKYGMLTVVGEGDGLRQPGGQKIRTINCVCECGNKTTIRLSHLIRGRISSCGCIIRTRKGKSLSDLYIVWNSMNTRCKENYFQADRYFQRGISVCDEWKNNFNSFEEWAKQNDYAKGLQLDRINNDKGYSPGNCRFVTSKTNNNNRSNTFYVNYKGKKRPLKILLNDLGNPNKYHTVYSRIQRGWNIENAIWKRA